MFAAMSRPSVNFTLICGGVFDDVVVGEHQTGLVVDEARFRALR